MDLITRRVIAKLEGTVEVSDDVLKEYTDPNSEKYDKMVEEIRKELKFTSLRYNRLDDLIEAVGLPAEKLNTCLTMPDYSHSERRTTNGFQKT